MPSLVHPKLLDIIIPKRARPIRSLERVATEVTQGQLSPSFWSIEPVDPSLLQVHVFLVLLCVERRSIVLLLLADLQRIRADLAFGEEVSDKEILPDLLS